MMTSQQSTNENTSRLNKILMAHYKKATAVAHNYIKVAINEQNIAEWYVMIENLSEPYTEGQYLFTMTAPNDFPFKPPNFQCLTPNGFYEPGGSICISIGSFHSNNYRPVLGMMGFAEQIMAGMLEYKDMGSGIRLLKTSDETKASLAKASKQYNAAHHSNIMRLFDKQLQ